MKTVQIERKLLPLMLAALLLTACSRESEEALSLPADAHSNAQIIAQTAAADVRLQEQARSGNRSAQIFDTETKLLQREHEKTGASILRAPRPPERESARRLPAPDRAPVGEAEVEGAPAACDPEVGSRG